MSAVPDRVRSGMADEANDPVSRSEDRTVRIMRGAVEVEHDPSGALVRIVGGLQNVTAPEPVTGQPAELLARARRRPHSRRDSGRGVVGRVRGRVRPASVAPAGPASG